MNRVNALNCKAWYVVATFAALITLGLFVLTVRQHIAKADYVFKAVEDGWSESDVVQACGLPDVRMESNAIVLVYLDYPKWFCDIFPSVQSGTTVVILGEGGAGPTTRWGPGYMRFQHPDN